EYVFTAGAEDTAQTTSWPDASSASVLATAGGGPNVVTWNLGSNTGAVGGETIISGYTNGFYALEGGGATTFQKYDVDGSSWTGRADALQAVAKGGALTTDAAGTIYALRGNGQ